MKIDDLVKSAAAEFSEQILEQTLRSACEKLERDLKLIRRPEAAVGIAESPLGDLLVAITGRGLALNHYVRGAADIETTIAHLRPYFDLVEDRRVADEVGAQVRRYLSGDSAALDQKIDLTLAATAFHKAVLTALMAVPQGAVLSYQALGAAVGSAHAARAIGNAMHNNPVPIYVPCHRVIASGGGIGGYGGGIARKLILLRAEGFSLDDSKIAGDAVWGHRRTRIYCKPGCAAAARADVARMLLFASPEQARKAGMRPCKMCKPA